MFLFLFLFLMQCLNTCVMKQKGIFCQDGTGTCFSIIQFCNSAQTEAQSFANATRETQDGIL